MSGLAQHREALRLEMEAAIRNSEPNPTRAVERASLAVVPASSEDTTTTPSTSMLAEIPPTKSKKSEKSKGKDVVPSTPKMKGAREVSEIDVPRKKSSQGSRQATATEFEETLVLVVHTLETCQLSGEFFENLPNYRWTREGLKLPDSRKDLAKLSRKSKG